MAILSHAKTSVTWFSLGCSVVSLYIFNFLAKFINEVLAEYVIIILIIYSILCYLLTWTIKSVYAYQIAIRSLGLGIAFGIALLISLWGSSSWRIFGWYLCLLSFFHISEFVTTALINPRALNLDSFLINHSREYTVAAIFSWIEFCLEWWLFPVMKEFSWISYVGVALCIGGELIRKLAMFTARSNFSHVIQVQREEGHVLVTHGIYSIWRHPSYVGWFWWSVGTQIVLCNPFCIIGYVIASWNFFNERVLEEEITLLNFFGEDYFKYQRRVPSGLPFISGFRVEL